MNKLGKYLKHLCALVLIGMPMLSFAEATKINLAQKTIKVTVSANADEASLVTDNARVKYWSTEGADLGQYHYVEFEWSATAKIEETTVYWAKASAAKGVALPSDAYLTYWDGEAWSEGVGLNEIDEQSVTTLESTFETKKMRIYMKSDSICGLREVRIFGYERVVPGELYEWPAYSSQLNYNYRNDYPNGVEPPTKLLTEKGQVGYKTYGWWAFVWGDKRNKYVTDEAIDNLLRHMDTEFAYFRNVLGWLPDKRARNGYYSTICLFGSGLEDGASNTDRGGWQSATWHNGSSWPMVLLSYYPVACFDPDFTYDEYYKSAVNDAAAQQGACVHEGIHAVFADLEGCKNAAWFHESGNTSMQADAELSKTPNVIPESMGFLSAGAMVAPFIPIECYSGWLLDGSFGGPSAQGVNKYNGSQQICTWRNLLGGHQYGELFPHFLTVTFGDGALPWVWRYCKDRVLSGIADSIGEVETRRLVREYRVKQAMIDFGKWSNASRALLDNNWLLSVKQEWSPYDQSVQEWKATPYANMYKCNETDSLGWWKPEYRTTPGWSGANQIPIHVSGEKGDIVRIYFEPLGDNMECQLAFRSKRGKVYYSQPVQGAGEVSIELADVPANNVIIAVVCNTDYIYKGEATRKAHYDYRLKMMDNAYQPASSNYKWYNYRGLIVDKNFDKDDYVSVDPIEEAVTFGFTTDKQVVKAGETLNISFTGASQWMVQVRMFAMNGRNVYNQSLLRDGAYYIPANVEPGMYILQAQNGREMASVKIVVE
ncbi:MAG: T9SS type A sorting domain-containing protein [Bacteroidaceae bacterium]|nr:T9SS type A sorting domain-containing protein [Bacteroidaceae bacterium]